MSPKKTHSTTRDIADSIEQKGQLSPISKSWFLGIGINEYQEFSNLNNALNDVNAIEKLLIEKYDIQESIILDNQKATRAGIIDMLDELEGRVHENDKLIIYYSGHGHLNKRTKLGYWIPYDAKKNRTANYIRNSTIRDYIKVINARHTLLISDSCFSGALFVRGATRSTLAIDELEDRTSRWAICSGRHDEEVYDGEPGTHSPFAASILNILQTNAHPKLNVAKLADQVVELTRANYVQLPEGNPLFGVGHMGGQYVFRLKWDEQAEWRACQAHESLNAYQVFLTKYPDSPFVPKAKERIKELEEEAFWKQSCLKHTILAYDEYCNQYPKGQHLLEAVEAIAGLEEERSWKTAAKKNKISSYRQYLVEYPDGKFKEEAFSKIELIKTGKSKSPFDAYFDKSWKKHLESIKKHIVWIVALLVLWLAVIIFYPSIFQPKVKYGSVSTQNQTYKTLQLGERTWLAENLNVAVQDSWCYQEENANCKAHGRLYTWEAAQEACDQLGPGWRLPTEKEWREMLESFGKGDEAHSVLVKGGRSGFNLMPGGYRTKKSGTFSGLDTVGYYWSSTEASDSGRVWGYKFDLSEEESRLGSYVKHWARSCRCVRDTSSDTMAIADEETKLDLEEGAEKVVPVFTHQFKGDILTVTISEGTFPSILRLKREGEEYYQKTFEAPGSDKISLTEYRKDPGEYQIEVTGPSGQMTAQAIQIDPPKKSSRFGSVRDLEGNRYKTVRMIGKTWMAENMKYNVGSGSYYYEEDPKNGERFGKLYGWSAAKTACNSLGKGWRLPSIEEWKSLLNHYGGYYDYTTHSAHGDYTRSYSALITQGSTGFDALLGGGYDDFTPFDDRSFLMGDEGYYWSSTKIKEYTDDKRDGIWIALFDLDDQTAGIKIDVEYYYTYSCRCVKD